MQIQILQLPDTTEYLTNYLQVPISTDNTLLLVFKTLYRSDDVYLDIYLNEISEDNLILAGRQLVPDSLICPPNYDLDFKYYINCIDQDDYGQPLTQYNMDRFYLQFTSLEGEEWVDEE